MFVTLHEAREVSTPKLKNFHEPRAGLGLRVRQLRTHLRLSQSELAERVGADGINTVSNLERGVPRNLAIEHLVGLGKLCLAEGVSLQWLVAGEGPMMAPPAAASPPISPAQAETTWLAALADAVARRLSARPAPPATDPVEDRTPEPAPTETQTKPDDLAQEPPGFRVVELLDPGFRIVATEEIPEDADPRGQYVPLIGRLSAGAGADTVEAEQFAPGRADAYLIYMGAPEAAFAVRVVGDSMLPDYADGDLVVVDGAKPVRSGVACVLVRHAGDRVARLKRIVYKGKIAILESLNPAYPPVRHPARNVAAFALIRHLPRIVHRGDRPTT